MNILGEIIAWKKMETLERRKSIPYSKLESSPLFARKCFSLAKKLGSENGPGIIAEFKRKSPSKGVINELANPGRVAAGYSDAGAVAVSILTDEKYFGGSLSDLLAARNKVTIPLLRKDFIVNEYQLAEAKASGADIVLLIAAALSKDEISHLAALARSLGMEVLFEVHGEEELDKWNPDVSFIGVNNRSLHTFKVDTDQSIRLAAKIPAGVLKISESGLSSPEVILKLSENGFAGFLIGETFMKNCNPASACRNLINELQKK